LLVEFEQANNYFELFFEKCKNPEDLERLVVLGDYIANLINLDKL